MTAMLPAELVVPALPLRRAQRLVEDPLLAYLGSLSPRSRLTVQERLRAVARTLGSLFPDRISLRRNGNMVAWTSVRVQE